MKNLISALTTSMTASNLMTSPNAAYLVSDGVSFRHDGTVGKHGSKIAVSRRLRCAIGFAGLSTGTATADTTAWLEGFSTQEDFVAALPAYLQARIESAVGQESAALLKQEVVAHVAMWSYAADRAIGLVCASPSVKTIGPQYVPYTVVPMEFVVSPSTVPPIRPPMFWNGERKSAVGLARAMMRAQRHVKFDSGYFMVGGKAEMAEVREDGVYMHSIMTWNDKLGEIIQP